MRTFGAGLTSQSYHSSLRVKLSDRPWVRVRGVLDHHAARPHRRVLRVPLGHRAHEPGVERVHVVLALAHRPARVVHAHVPAAAADVLLQRGPLRHVEQHATRLREDDGVLRGEVLRGERRGVLGLLDLDGLGVLGAQLRGEVAHGLAGLHVRRVEVRLVEQQDAQHAVVDGACARQDGCRGCRGRLRDTGAEGSGHQEGGERGREVRSAGSARVVAPVRSA
nr:hypothetical protein GCM10025730_19370 [Promicromonospora thailandica]